MPLLPPQDFKLLAWQPVGGTGGIADVLTAIATALASVTYYDGAARVPGIDSAWTVEFAQAGPVALVLAPPAPAPGVLNQRVIVGGQAAAIAGTISLLASDAAATNMLFVNTFKNTGNPATFTAWDAALPLTGAGQIGYARSSLDLVSNPVGHVLVIEGTESIAIALRYASGTVSPLYAGAVLDPASTNILDAETDGRLYGQLSCGSDGAAGSSFWSSTPTATGAFLNNSASNGDAKTGVFTPGIDAVLRPIPVLDQASTLTVNATNLRSASLTVFERRNRTYQRTGGGIWLGRLRDAWIATNAICGDVLRANPADSTTDLAYAISGSGVAAQNAVWFATALGSEC